VFTYTPAALKPTAELIQNFEALVKGDVLAPAEVEQKLGQAIALAWDARPLLVSRSPR